MNWAVDNKCEVISMSLGGPGQCSPPFEQAAERALHAGCLFIVAAGNDSRRPAYIAPAEQPGNCQSVVSVAAVTEARQVAAFSCGGKVNIAGPGVNVFSTVPMPRRYGMLSGTSMATPHVAGVAALWAQSDQSMRGDKLRRLLQQNSEHMPFPATDVGAGLVQSP